MNRSLSGFPNKLWRQFFYSPLASVISIGLFLVVGALGWYAWKWGVADAIFRADFKACMQNQDGACWGFVTEKWRLILFGRYPYEQQWRPAVATITIIASLVITAIPALWTKKALRLYAFCGLPPCLRFLP